MLIATTHERVLHHRHVAVELHAAAIVAEHGLMQDATARPNDDVTDEHSRRRHPGAGRDPWTPSLVFEQHDATP
jgi:hypothetical protein